MRNASKAGMVRLQIGLWALVGAVALLGSCAMTPPSPPLSAAKRDFDPRYTDWNLLLARYVTPAGVDYAGMKKEQGRLEIALAEMAEVTEEQFAGWSRESQQALLINAHNAHAVERIVQAYPVRSMGATTFLPWSARNVRNIRLLGREWSLDALVDEILGYPYQESRTLFLLNWGVKGCAPLPPVAVTGQNLASLLERQTRAFLTDNRYQQYNQEKHILYVSRLLKWYRPEIERDYVTLWDFIKRYLPAEELKRMGLRLAGPRIRFLSFDRDLNEISTGGSAK